MGATKQIELSTGEKITVDVSTLTVGEWRGFFDTTQSNEDGDKVITRMTGVSADKLLDMLRADYAIIFRTIMTLSNSAADPNSASESTSD